MQDWPGKRCLVIYFFCILGICIDACEQGVYDLNGEEILYVKDEYGSGVGFRGWNLSMWMNWIFFQECSMFQRKTFLDKGKCIFLTPQRYGSNFPN